MPNFKKYNEEEIKKYKEAHPPPDESVCSLIKVAEDEIDAAAFTVRIPYEELSYLHCITVDILLLLASGMRPKDVAVIISKRYDLDCTIDRVYSAKRNHKTEFYKMLSFYREIFLNQQVQSLEQMCVAKLSDALPTIEIHDLADALKAAQLLKLMTEVRKTKEDDGNYAQLNQKAINALEGKMKAITGGDKK